MFSGILLLKYIPDREPCTDGYDNSDKVVSFPISRGRFRLTGTDLIKLLQQFDRIFHGPGTGIRSKIP